MQQLKRIPMALLAALPALAMLIVAVVGWPSVARWQGDLAIYARYADKLVNGGIPYRDFHPEYPPLALLPFMLPRLLVGGQPLSEEAYRWLFLLGNALFFWLATLAVLQIARKHVPRSDRLVIFVLTLLAVILAPLIAWRFDMFPALFVILAVLAATQELPLVSGVWIGLGIAAKLFPMVLGPVEAVAYLAARRWRALAWLAAGGVIALLVTVLPFWLIDRVGLLEFLTYHEQRGVQIESFAGGIICLAQALGWTKATVAFNFGALHLASPWATAILPWLTPLLAVAYLGLLTLIYLRSRADMREYKHLVPTTIMRGYVAALLVFIVSNKVFSPQYMIWLLPFVPFFSRRQIGLMIGIAVATVAIFPYGYDGLLAFELGSVILLNVRNLALLVLLCSLVVDLLPAHWRFRWNVWKPTRSIDQQAI